MKGNSGHVLKLTGCRTAYIGLLKVKECFIGEGCEKIKIANSDYNDFSSGGKVTSSYMQFNSTQTGFILLILGSMALCLSAAYLAMNSCNKRMEHSGVHHCLKSHAMLGSLLIACAWILWLVLSPHPPNFHLGLSFMLAVLGSALGLAAYVISIAVKQDSYKALA